MEWNRAGIANSMVTDDMVMRDKGAVLEFQWKETIHGPDSHKHEK